MTPNAQKEYVADSDSLGALADYFNAAINGEEDKSKLNRLWDVQMQIILSRPAPSPQNEHDCLCVIKCNPDNCGTGKCKCADCWNPITSLGCDGNWEQCHNTATRNATLDAVQVKLQECSEIDDNDQYYLWLEDAESVIYSMRGEP